MSASSLLRNLDEVVGFVEKLLFNDPPVIACINKPVALLGIKDIAVGVGDFGVECQLVDGTNGVISIIIPAQVRLVGADKSAAGDHVHFDTPDFANRSFSNEVACLNFFRFTFFGFQSDDATRHCGSL